jgi:hypothetical protein
MTSKMYAGKVRLVTYVTEDVYKKLDEERQRKGESESGLVASILNCFVEEACEQ